MPSVAPPAPKCAYCSGVELDIRLLSLLLFPGAGAAFMSRNLKSSRSRKYKPGWYGRLIDVTYDVHPLLALCVTIVAVVSIFIAWALFAIGGGMALEPIMKSAGLDVTGAAFGALGALASYALVLAIRAGEEVALLRDKVFELEDKLRDMAASGG